MTGYFYRLTRLHHKLADAIDRESGLPSPSAIKLLRLKRLRLAIKARISRFQLKQLRA